MTIGKKDVTLDEVVKHIKSRYEMIEKDNAFSVEMRDVEYALASYVAARKRRGLLEFASKLGLDGLLIPDMNQEALLLLEAVERLPELVRRSATIVKQVAESTPIQAEEWPGDDSDDAPTQNVVTGTHFLNIKERIKRNGGDLCLVGGSVVPKKLAWLRSHMNTTHIVWIGTEDDPDSRGCERIANQMKAGVYVGVLFFNGCMSHLQAQPLINAGRTSKCPAVAAGKPGQGLILTALTALDTQLGQRASGSAA